MPFREIEFGELDINPFTKVDDWALLTAGSQDSFNFMTATGVMFGKFFLNPMIQVYVHPDRYSYGFFNSSDLFTVSFFDIPHHPALQVAGSRHGNETDKLAESGLTPIFQAGTILFEEARLVFVCRKAYHHDVTKENFDSEDLFGEYYRRDTGVYHRVFMGLVQHVFESTRPL